MIFLATIKAYSYQSKKKAKLRTKVILQAKIAFLFRPWVGLDSKRVRWYKDKGKLDLYPLENLENWKAFSSQGKVREFWTGWTSQGKSHKILENLGSFRQMLFVIFSDI